jgi:CYTH domain-containing protein
LKTGVSVGALLVVCSGAGVFASMGLFEFDFAAFEFDEFELTAELLPASPQAKESSEIISADKSIAVLDLILISFMQKTLFQQCRVSTKSESIINRPMMDKTYRTELSRLFLVEALPAPLTPASSHLQIFDNYITGTRLRLRNVRVPETKEWTYLLQQRLRLHEGDLSCMKVAEIHLNEAEHTQLETFDGNEIRKNRYFHEFDARSFAFDIYLGALWGLNRARVDFQSDDELRAFRPPPFAIFEVTYESFFDDANLVYRKFEDVQEAVTKLVPLSSPMPDE